MWATGTKPNKGLSKVRALAIRAPLSNGSTWAAPAWSKPQKRALPLDHEVWHVHTPKPSFQEWCLAAPNLQVGVCSSSFPTCSHSTKLRVRAKPTLSLHRACCQTRSLLHSGADAFVSGEVGGKLRVDARTNPPPPLVNLSEMMELALSLESDFNFAVPLCDPSHWQA